MISKAFVSHSVHRDGGSASKGVCLQGGLTPGGLPTGSVCPLQQPLQQSVRILLECILVYIKTCAEEVYYILFSETVYYILFDYVPG